MPMTRISRFRGDINETLTHNPGGPGMAPQYGQMSNAAGGVPGSAGGYGCPDQMQGGYGGPSSAGGYPPNGQAGNYRGYQA